jgi:hypothetical protein
MEKTQWSFSLRRKSFSAACYLKVIRIGVCLPAPGRSVEAAPGRRELVPQPAISCFRREIV